MKKTLSAFAALLLLFSMASAQQAVPANVKAAFEQKYPQVLDADIEEWEDEDGVWEVDFSQNGQFLEAKFDGAGQWLSTESEISPNTAPTAILDGILNEWSDADIEEVKVMETPSGNMYEVELTSGGKVIEALLDGSGTLQGHQIEEDVYDNDDE